MVFASRGPVEAKVSRLSETAIESRHIALMRVLCIYFMMSVHLTVRPSGTLIVPGDLDLVDMIWVDWLGRASVAALSFVSGVLLWRGLAVRKAADMALRRAQTLLVPMIVWNIIFIGLAIAKALASAEADAVGLPETLLDAIKGFNLLNAVAGLNGSTINNSLFFLRDLFMVSVILIVLRRIVGRWPLAAVGLAFLAAVTDSLEPLLFRPSILLFATAGFAFARFGMSLSAFHDVRLASTVLAVGAGLLALGTVSPDRIPETQAALDNLGKRIVLTVGLLSTTAWLARMRAAATVASLAGAAYATYLLHEPLARVARSAHEWAFGAPSGMGEVLFFLSIPFLAFAVGGVMMLILPALPRALQIALVGKARRPGSSPKG